MGETGVTLLVNSKTFSKSALKMTIEGREKMVDAWDETRY
jgi:hypothetical protein